MTERLIFLKKKIIGIDIDGVITDEHRRYNRNIWHHFLCEYLGKEVEKKEDIYNIYKAYDLEKEVIDNFLEKKIDNIYEELIPSKGVQRILKDLKKKTFKIILITARQEKYKSVTEKWLKKYNIVYDKLIHRVDKVPSAKKENIELFIEDDKNNAEDFKKNGIEVILFDKKHNRETAIIEDEKRVYTWEQVEDIIYEYFNIKK